MEHEDAVGDVLYHAEIVGDHDDGGARPGRADGGEGVEDLNARGHVDGAHRLVGEQLLERVLIAGGRVRIARDPSPRQYCVKAGWLDSVGQTAICLPNHTSVELVGSKPNPYDSLSY